MRLVIAQCTVDYIGRLTAHLPSARRLLLIKADGSVSVHADDRAYKPLNWMSPPCSLLEDATGELPVWVVQNKSGGPTFTSVFVLRFADGELVTSVNDQTCSAT